MFTLFLDIETAHTHKDWKDLPAVGQQAWEKKMRRRAGESDATIVSIEDTWINAPLYAEFSEIICISIGECIIDTADPDYDPRQGPNTIYIKAITGATERDILLQLTDLISRRKYEAICAHNGKTFDFPFITRRYLINGLTPPWIFQTEGKKPWELHFQIDTVELWRCGDVKYYVSLITLAFAFGVPSPKGEMDGSMVSAAYHAGEIDKIKRYCNSDVLTLILVYLKMTRRPLIERVIYG